jgi:uncharacterized protein involved in exopolysaccharide biosynthesis
MAPSNLDPEDVAKAEGEDEEEEFDFQRVRELAGFVGRAPRRHPKLAVFTFLIAGTLGLIGTAITPRTFTADVKILAQKNLVLPALGNPGRAVPREADNPTKNVVDTVLRRENLVALVKSLNLMDWWDVGRPKVSLYKDAVMFKIFGGPSEEDKLNVIVEVLEKRLQVQADDSTVTISVDWSDPKVAYDIATHVEKTFLNAGYDSEVAMINDAIRILEEHSRTEQTNVDAALNEVQRLHAEATGVPAPPPPAPVASDGTRPPPPPRPIPVAPPAALAAVTGAKGPDPALVKSLADKRAAIKTIEDDRTRHLRELQTQLQDALATLAPAHPSVVALKSKLDAARVDPPELVTLRNEEKALADQVADQQKAAAVASIAEAQAAAQAKAQQRAAHHDIAPVVAPTPKPAAPGTPANTNPEMYAALDALRAAQGKQQEILRRIDAARIELDVERAAFKYRFSEVRPAEVPKKPRKPKVPLFVAGALLGAVLLAFVSSTLADRRSGLFVEDWQVRRKLKIPVLGEIRAPRSS